MVGIWNLLVHLSVYLEFLCAFSFGICIYRSFGENRIAQVGLCMLFVHVFAFGICIYRSFGENR